MRGDRPALSAEPLRAENPNIEDRIQKWLTGVDDGSPVAHWYYRGPREKGSVRYAQFNIRKNGTRAVEYVHRLMFVLYRADIPEGYEVAHECQTKRCVRPDHLELRTPAEHRWLDASFRKFIGKTRLNNIFFRRYKKDDTD